MRRRFLSFLICVLLIGLPRSLDASHFRFGHLSWQRSASGNPLEIDVTVVEAWRSGTSGPGSFLYTLDHSGATFSSIGATQIGSLTDITGEQYEIFSKTLTFTFPSNGVYTITSSETFRLIDVINAPASNAKLQLVLDLRPTNTGTPQTTSPVILQLPINTTNVVPIPLIDPDSDPIAVRFATVVESGIPAIPEVGGNQLSVSQTGVLNWDTTGGAIGQRFAVQLAIEENHPGFTTTGRVPLEFIIELVNISTNDPPTCTGPTNTMSAEVGTPLTVSFMATDPEGGPLSVSGQQLPPGATLSPASGTTNASPSTVQLTWVPAIEHLGQTFPVSILFTDDHGLQAGCGFTISVSSILPLPGFDLVSVNSAGAGSGGGNSVNPAISSGARFVVFASDAPNLVTNDFNAKKDVFRRDRGTGETVLLSVNQLGRSANTDSANPVISANGRFVAFESRASDIVANDNNGAIDVFVYDASSNAAFLVSTSTNGVSGSGDSFAPRFSADGNLVVFVSTADNLTANDTNGTGDVFVRNLTTGVTTLVSVSTNGQSGAGASSSPSISTNGRFVVFASAAPDLAANDANNNTDVFWRDLNSGMTALVSVNTNGQSGNFISFDPTINPAGTGVAFVSQATDLVPLMDNNIQTDVYFRDVFNAVTLPVSRNHTGAAMGNAGSSTPIFDRSGSNVLFVSIATDLATSDNNGEQDVFLWNRDTQAHELISVNSSGTATGNGASGVTAASMSAGLRYVTFFSDASDLVPNTDSNGVADVYVRDRTEGVTKLISYNPANNAIGNGASFAPFISADGSVIVFATDASNLATNDVNAATDIVATSLTNALPSSVALSVDAFAPGSSPAGVEFPVTFSVVNYGPEPVSDVQLTALATSNLRCVHANPTSGVFDPQTDTWQIGTIPSLQAASLQMVMIGVEQGSARVRGRIEVAPGVFIDIAPPPIPVINGNDAAGVSINITPELSVDVIGPIDWTGPEDSPWSNNIAWGLTRIYADSSLRHTPGIDLVEVDGGWVLNFNANVLGTAPHQAGFALGTIREVTVEAFDAAGRQLASLELDNAAQQFTGIEHEGGIGSLRFTGINPDELLQLHLTLSTGVPVPEGLLLWGRGEPGSVGRVGRGYGLDVNSKRSFAPAVPLTGTSAALELWIRPDQDLDAKSGWTPLAVMINGGEDFNTRARGLDLFHANGALSFAVPVVNGLVREVVEHPADLTAGRWYHIAGVVADGVQTLYLDGQAVAQRTLTAPVSFSPADVCIGEVALSGLSVGFPGVVDEIALYDQALDAATITELFVQGDRGKVRPDLRASRLGGAPVLEWSGFFPGYRLQTTPRIDVGSWQDWPAPAVLRNGAWQVSIPGSAVFHYYRLTR